MKVSLFNPYRSAEIEQKVLEVLRSGFIATGPYVESFTRKFSNLIEQKNVVTINDISNAVQIALHLSNIQPGDEVIATPFSCMSSNSPIAVARAHVKWADMDPATATVTVDSIKKLITKKTKAMLIYHVAGYPGPIDEISKLCELHGIKLIEDCNNALNATLKKQKVGSYSDFSVYSFYPNRQINAGEGGALICKLESDFSRAIKLRRYGIDLHTFRTSDGEINPASDIPEIGWGATLNNLCSAMGLVQVDTVQSRIELTRKVAQTYLKALSGHTDIISVNPLEDADPSFWVYIVRTKKQAQLLQFLKQAGIACSKLHQLNTVYSGFNTSDVYVPGAIQFMNELVCIPCGWWMNEEQVQYVITRLNEFT